jgi:hypothetical protein
MGYDPLHAWLKVASSQMAMSQAWVTQAKAWVTQWKSLGDPVENPA